MAAVNKVIFAIAACALMGSMLVFSVHETEKAIKFKFGEVVEYDFKPGVHFKLPYPFNDIKKFDSRIQTMVSKPEGFLTAEKKNVLVDFFVKWRIDDVSTFYQRVGGDIFQANNRLDPIIKDAFRGEFAKREIKQLVSTDRKVIRDILINNSQALAKNLGLKIIDVQVMRIDLPEEVSSSVYRRMEAERERIAREFRSQGEEAAEKIRADADRQSVVTKANAFKDAEKMRGEGDAKSAEIYARGFGADPEFFAFYRSLNAYQKTFHKSSTLVLDGDSEYLRYLKRIK